MNIHDRIKQIVARHEMRTGTYPDILILPSSLRQEFYTTSITSPEYAAAAARCLQHEIYMGMSVCWLFTKSITVTHKFPSWP